MAGDALVDSLNSSPTYDHSILLNSTLHDNDDAHIFTHINISSKYYDNNSLIETFSNTNTPLILSLNIQSLPSKYNALLDLITNLTNNNIRIDIIALQETWNIPYPDLLAIPGFHPLIFETRPRNRGGGWILY